MFCCRPVQMCHERHHHGHINVNSDINNMASIKGSRLIQIN